MFLIVKCDLFLEGWITEMRKDRLDGKCENDSGNRYFSNDDDDDEAQT